MAERLVCGSASPPEQHLRPARYNHPPDKSKRVLGQLARLSVLDCDQKLDNLLVEEPEPEREAGRSSGTTVRKIHDCVG